MIDEEIHYENLKKDLLKTQIYTFMECVLSEAQKTGNLDSFSIVITNNDSDGLVLKRDFTKNK